MHKTLPRLLALIAIAMSVTAIVVNGCGSPKVSSPTRKNSTTTTSLHVCTPANTTLGCNLPPAPLLLPFAQAPALARGIDFAWGGPSAATMRAHGWTFGASYLSFDQSKNWQRGQVREYAAAHIARVFVWETSATRALDGCAAGRIDARNALVQAASFGFRVIYFAVDFELQPSQHGAVASYFRCIAGQIGVDHTGAYGGLATISLLFDQHLIRYGWQTYAWSGGRWDRRAQLEQWLNGSSVDYDRAIARDFGQVPYAAPKPPPPPSHAAVLRLRRELRADLRRHHCWTPPKYGGGKYHHVCGHWRQRWYHTNTQLKGTR
jgi:hypothetical protein